MKKLIYVLLILPFLSFAGEVEQEDKKGFWLKQVDYRHRVSSAVKIPAIFRLRLRAFYEFRYNADKKPIPVKKESL